LNSASGFASRKDAELVAGVIVKKIQNGDMMPKLNKRTIDSLELILKINE
jgi:TRAP-type mannitol/chloroaromatic compound transport system substrate-binding protein